MLNMVMKAVSKLGIRCLKGERLIWDFASFPWFFISTFNLTIEPSYSANVFPSKIL